MSIRNGAPQARSTRTRVIDPALHTDPGGEGKSFIAEALNFHRRKADPAADGVTR